MRKGLNSIIILVSWEVGNFGTLLYLKELLQTFKGFYKP